MYNDKSQEWSKSGTHKGKSLLLIIIYKYDF